MSKRMIVYLLVCLPVFFACHQEKGDLPAFNLLMLDSATKFSTSQIPTGKPIVLLYFSPDCDHCQHETVSLLKNIDSLLDVRFYFVTIDPMDRMRVYNDYYKIYDYHNITLGRDYDWSFVKYFKDASPPYMLVYDRHKMARARFKGETEAKDIIKIIDQL